VESNWSLKFTVMKHISLLTLVQSKKKLSKPCKIVMEINTVQYLGTRVEKLSYTQMEVLNEKT